MNIRIPGWRRGDAPEELLTKEWLVTNALGGYASGTLAGVATRRYHGVLVASLPAPHGRVVMLNHLDDFVVLPDGTSLRLGGSERSGGTVLYPQENLLEEFHLENGFPVWRFSTDSFVLERRVTMPHLQNSTYLRYELLEGDSALVIRMEPSIHFRRHEDLVSGVDAHRYRIEADGVDWQIVGETDLPCLRVQLHGGSPGFASHEETSAQFIYRLEQSRGYESEGGLWTPGTFHFTLSKGGSGTLIASTEPLEAIRGVPAAEAFETEQGRREDLLARFEGETPAEAFAEQLVLAADQFIISPESRLRDRARAHAAGEDPHTVIAGYHWFTDWGRDTMISLEGLTLSTGRYRDASAILRIFASYIHDGLIPNMFPEGQREGLYHTADATMWFFHALRRYIDYTGDRELVRKILPNLVDIIEWHYRGTEFNIRVDPADGLLSEGAEGYQLTWMDAKVDGWVVTPRRGKPVEINALFYNALRIVEELLREEGQTEQAGIMGARAEQTYASFNERFWYDEGGYLYDVVDGESGNDHSLRPNQIFAISLRHPILDQSRWEAVVSVVRDNLLTPLGLRSLAPSDRDYKKVYFGDLRSRDAAYHQGTVWAWLIGPYVDAWLKLYPDDLQGARKCLEGFSAHLSDGGIGTISEIFDAEVPHTQRGCIAQAWSVAEVLRCWIKTGPRAAATPVAMSGVSMRNQ